MLALDLGYRIERVGNCVSEKKEKANHTKPNGLVCFGVLEKARAREMCFCLVGGLFAFLDNGAASVRVRARIYTPRRKGGGMSDYADFSDLDGRVEISGRVTLEFTCPRCGTRQTATLNVVLGVGREPSNRIAPCEI